MDTAGPTLADLLGRRNFLAASATKGLSETARSIALSSASAAASNSIAKATLQMSEQTRAQLAELVKPPRVAIPQTVLTALQASATPSQSTARMLSGMQAALASTALPAPNTSWARIAAEMTKDARAQQSALHSQIAKMVAPPRILAETAALAKLQAQLPATNTMAVFKFAPATIAAYRLQEKQSKSIARAFSGMQAALASTALPAPNTSWARVAADMSKLLQAQESRLQAQIAAMVAPSKFVAASPGLTDLLAQLRATDSEVSDAKALLVRSIAKPTSQIVPRVRDGEQLPECEEVVDAAAITAYWLWLACALVIACAVEPRSIGVFTSALAVLWMLFELVEVACESRGVQGAILVLGLALKIRSKWQEREHP